MQGDTFLTCVFLGGSLGGGLNVCVWGVGGGCIVGVLGFDGVI